MCFYICMDAVFASLHSLSEGGFWVDRLRCIEGLPTYECKPDSRHNCRVVLPIFMGQQKIQKNHEVKFHSLYLS